MSDLYFRPFTDYTGGEENDLDGFDGETLQEGEAALVVKSSTGVASIHYLDSDSGEDEDSPDIVEPDTNAENKRWKRAKVMTDASVVDFLQSGTGTVQRTIADRLSDIHDSPKNYDGVGDGAEDDTAAWQAAIDNGSSVIDGGGLTWLITAPLTGIGSNTTIQNAVLDFSTQTDKTGIDRCIDIRGTKGSAVALTANTDLDEATVTVGDTSTFAADGLVWLESTTVWDALTSTHYGQYGRVKSVDNGTELTLYSSVLLAFTTADSATISPVTPVENVNFVNVTIIGRQSGTQAGIYVMYGQDIKISKCIFENIDYVSVAFWRCVSSVVDRCDARFIRVAGTAYGYGIWGGCYDCRVVNSTGEDCRHTVTIGDNDGINMFSKVIGCHAISSKDAGFDSHAGSMYTDFIGNTVEMSYEKLGDSSHMGLIIQGQHAKFIGNTVIGPFGTGIFYQPLFQNGYLGSVDMINNTVFLDDVGDGATTANGLYVQVEETYGASIDGCVIDGNKVGGGENNVTGSRHVYALVSRAGQSIDNLVISKNIALSTAVSNSITVRTSGEGAEINNVIVSENSMKTDGSRALYFLADGASSEINNITGSGNIIDGGSTQSINFLGTDGAISKVRFGKNIYLNDTVKISLTKTTDYVFDDAEIGTPQTVTDAAVTIGPLTNHYIFNRAGTVTATLPAASDCVGRELFFKTIQAQAVASASSNVVPVTSDSAGTAILGGTDGEWALLKSDGTNWIIMQAG